MYRWRERVGVWRPTASARVAEAVGSRRLLLQLLPQLLLQLLLHLLLQLLLQLLLRLLLQFLLQLLQLLAQLVVQLLVQLLLQPQPCTQLSPGPKTTSAREEGPLQLLL